MKNDFSINQTNPDEYVSGVDDIKQCWWNILRTVPGSIPLMPEFGCDLYKYVDKPITLSFSEAANKITSALAKWETRATISKVTRTIDGSRIYINVVGIYISTGESIISQYSLTDLFGTTLPTSNTFDAGSIGTVQSIYSGNTPEALAIINSPSGGTGSYYYQWQVSSDGEAWEDIDGETDTSYSPDVLSETTYYKLVVSDSQDNEDVSNIVKITVCQALEAGSITGYDGTEVASGSEITLTANALYGLGSYSYTWYVDGTAAGTGETLTLTITADTEVYYVVSDGVSEATSGVEILIEVSISGVFAGTSNSGLLIKSENLGLSFGLVITSQYGVPCCFCKLSNGNILYGTSTGYIVNITTGSYGKVSDNKITDVINYGGNYYVIDYENIYKSGDGITFTEYMLGASGTELAGQLFIETIDLLLCITAFSIINIDNKLELYTNNEIGAFCSFCILNGYAYVGTGAGYVCRNSVAGNYTDWLVLGQKPIGKGGVLNREYGIYNMCVVNNNRIILGIWCMYDDGGCYYTDDLFETFTEIKPGDNARSGAIFTYLGNNIVLCTGRHDDALPGYVFRSEDNGITWVEIDGNPQQNDGMLTCLTAL
jgi:phage baseplate assembly protein W